MAKDVVCEMNLETPLKIFTEYSSIYLSGASF
jgi:hypothetical protein